MDPATSTSAEQPSSQAEQPFGPPPDEPDLVADLKAVHAYLRRCHDACLEIAGAATNSLEARRRLRHLATYYVEFVHAHHTGEERELFPALRRESPTLGPIVDKLEADHDDVSQRLRDVRAALEEVNEYSIPETVDDVAKAIEALGDTLFTHLAFEEESISPTLRAWTYLPPGH